jgi:hypothetical protein
MYSSGFIRFSTGLDIVSMLNFEQFHEIIAASNDSAKCRSKSNLEAT